MSSAIYSGVNSELGRQTYMAESQNVSSQLRIVGAAMTSVTGARTAFSDMKFSAGTFAELKNILSREDSFFGKWTFFSKMPLSAQSAALCAFLALRDASFDAVPGCRIGILAKDDFCHCTDQRAYYDDYLAGGKNIARSSLFVHTLPTSAAADASIILGLNGPLMYLRDRDSSWGNLTDAASSYIADGMADCMLMMSQNADSWLALLLAGASASSLCKRPIALDSAEFMFSDTHQDDSAVFNLICGKSAVAPVNP